MTLENGRTKYVVVICTDPAWDDSRKTTINLDVQPKTILNSQSVTAKPKKERQTNKPLGADTHIFGIHLKACPNVGQCNKQVDSLLVRE